MSTDLEEQLQLIDLLMRSGDPAVVEPLIELLWQTGWGNYLERKLRAALIRALAHLRSPLAYDVLSHSLLAREGNVMELLNALIACGDPRALSAIGDTVRQRWQPATNAKYQQACRELGPKADVQLLIDLLPIEDVVARMIILGQLGDRRDPAAIPALAAYIENPRAQTANNAVKQVAQDAIRKLRATIESSTTLD